MILTRTQLRVTINHFGQFFFTRTLLSTLWCWLCCISYQCLRAPATWHRAWYRNSPRTQDAITTDFRFVNCETKSMKAPVVSITTTPLVRHIRAIQVDHCFWRLQSREVLPFIGFIIVLFVLAWVTCAAPTLQVKIVIVVILESATTCNDKWA